MYQSRSASKSGGKLVGPERFYYDKSTWTGVHTKGGPTIIGSGASIGEGYSDLGQFILRDHVQDDWINQKKWAQQAEQDDSSPHSPQLRSPPPQQSERSSRPQQPRRTLDMTGVGAILNATSQSFGGGGGYSSPEATSPPSQSVGRGGGYPSPESTSPPSQSVGRGGGYPSPETTSPPSPPSRPSRPQPSRRSAEAVEATSWLAEASSPLPDEGSQRLERHPKPTRRSVLAVEEQPRVTNERICDACGTRLEGDSIFCQNCGRKWQPQAEPPTAARAPRKPEKSEIQSLDGLFDDFFNGTYPGRISSDDWLSRFDDIDKNGNRQISRREWFALGGDISLFDKIKTGSDQYMTRKDWLNAFNKCGVDAGGYVSSKGLAALISSSGPMRSAGGSPRRSASRSSSPRKSRGPERFFYDKSSYTGVHKKGGPTIIDGRGSDKYSDLSEMTRTNLGVNMW